MKCISAAYLDLRKKHFEPPNAKTKMTFAPSEDSGQPGHPPSLIRVFAVRSIAMFLQANSEDTDLSFRWAHRSFYVMPRLNFLI